MLRFKERFQDFLYGNWIPISIYLSSTIFLIVSQVQAPTNGDTYLYANSIINFSGPIIHLGYYILGRILYIFTALLGVSPVLTLGYLSAICGGLAIVFIYQITIVLFKDNRLVGVMASFILLFSGAFWFYAFHGEVYIPQLACVTFAIFLQLKKKPLLSSLIFLLAVSITPTSALVFPGLIYLMYFANFTKKQRLNFILPILLLAIFVFAWKFQIVIGIMAEAIFSPSGFLKEASVINLLSKIAQDLVTAYGKSFNIISILVVYGFWQLYRSDRKTWMMLLFFIIPFSLYLLNIGLLSDDHLIITFLPLSIYCAFGVMKLIDKFKLSQKLIISSLIIIIFIHGWFSYHFHIGAEYEDSQEFESLIYDFNNIFEKDAILISPYTFGIGFWYFTQKEDEYYLQKGEPNNFVRISESDNKDEKFKKAFWINIHHFLDSFNSIKLKELIHNRPLYLVEKKVKRTIITKSIETVIKNEQKEPMNKRLTGFLGKNINTQWLSERILESGEYYIYKISEI